MTNPSITRTLSQLPRNIARKILPSTVKSALKNPRAHLEQLLPYPSTSKRLELSTLFKQWWYYSVELLPGLVAQGRYPNTMPNLPRTMLSRCHLAGTHCLDMGTMEGITPVIMKKRGAEKVLAIDATNHCWNKIKAVQHYHKTQFDYRSVGLMYGLDKKINASFDLINCSGLLYHVFSPLLILAGIRPLLKRNGLMVISTNVILDESHFMEFNNAGRLQEEQNTFWYLSTGFLDYLLRYLRLLPIDCEWVDHKNLKTDVRYTFDKPSGYASVVCRAVDDMYLDHWAERSSKESWEYTGFIDMKRANSHPVSRIRYLGDERNLSIANLLAIKSTEHAIHNHTLKLSDQT